MNRKPVSPDVALVRLETLCARSEQCTFELRQKLFRWGIAQADADKIVKSLEERRFVDDARFAPAFVRDRVLFGGYGRVRIRLELARRKIPREIADAALAQIDETQYGEKLLSIVRSKAQRIKDIETWEGRNRLYRKIVSRGFESERVIAAMKTVLSQLR